jgi:acetate kinase
MLVLVANLGSTSFKFKVLDSTRDFAEVARGGYERIGQANGDFRTHAEVIDVILKQLPTPPDAIGFKAVHGGPISGAVRVDDNVLATMEQFADVAPAHNPVYIAAMRSFREKLPNVPQVAAFETAFHATVPESRKVYAIPWEWTEAGIKRYGFHGASHRYVSGRVRELVPNARRVITCHLGGSSSVTAVLDGKSVGTSMGLTPQTGLPQNNRVGDFDTFALLKLTKQGLSVDEILKKLGKEGGLQGISGVSNDMRDIEKAAEAGNARAQLALDAFIESVRSYVGQYLVALGGIDVIAFAGGIGENGAMIRERVCAGLDFVGVEIDPERNKVRGKEAKVSRDDGKAQVWVVPTNEELVVARQTVETLVGSRQ